jgi:hypothetical protein
MPDLKDLTGQTFGRLRVVGRGADCVSPKGKHVTRFECVCDCGNAVLVAAGKLLRGRTKSCGCFRSDNARIQETTHGEASTSIYNTWKHAKSRCCNPGNRYYEGYGGRGITMYEPWLSSYQSFASWIRDNLGPRPSPDHSLDRIDNDGNYEPGNLRWATDVQQQRNRRSTKVTATVVARVRAMVAAGVRQKDIAAGEGLSLSHVKAIAQGRIWRE